MQTAKRDTTAGVKLLGGLLRLDALQPNGFTAQELADHAEVKWETAREFIRESGFTKVVAGRKPKAQPGGRPAKIYQLLPECRAKIVQRLAQIRQVAGEGLPTP